MLYSWHADSSCYKVHAVQLLYHVSFYSSGFIQHFSSQIKGLPTTWNSENSKNEALIIGLIGDLFITSTLETVEDLRNVEWRYA